MWRKGDPVHCWQDCKLVQPLWKAICRFFKTLKTEPLYDLAISLLSIYPKKTETLIQKKYTQTNVHWNIIYNSQEMEAT